MKILIFILLFPVFASAQLVDTAISKTRLIAYVDSANKAQDSITAANLNPGVMSRNEVNASLLRRLRVSDSNNIYVTPYFFQNATSNYYTRTEVDGFLFGKTNTATTAGLTNRVNTLEGGKLDITTAQTTYALANHMHSISQVTGLQTALDGKQASGSYYLASNPNGYISSYTETDPIWSGVAGNYRTLTQNNALYKAIGYTPSSAEITTALGFTPYNSNNPNGYISSVPAQTFASLTGKPTTLLGYGITDAYPLTGNPQGYLTAVPAQSWSSITGKPTTLAGYGITDGATTTALTAGLAGKEPTISAGTTAQYYRGDKTWQTLPVYTPGTGISINSGVISRSKRQETYTGTTDASGNYTVVFATPYAVTPNVQPNILGGTYLQRMITNASATGFTINAVTQNTNTLLGIVNLVAGTTVIQGASIQVLVTEN